MRRVMACWGIAVLAAAALQNGVSGQRTETRVVTFARDVAPILYANNGLSAGKVLKTPLPGGGKPNAACAGVQRQDVPRDPENGQSVGSIISYGPFRAADFGDATQDIEFDRLLLRHFKADPREPPAPTRARILS